MHELFAEQAEQNDGFPFAGRPTSQLPEASLTNAIESSVLWLREGGRSAKARAASTRLSAIQEYQRLGWGIGPFATNGAGVSFGSVRAIMTGVGRFFSRRYRGFVGLRWALRRG